MSREDSSSSSSASCSSRSSELSSSMTGLLSFVLARLERRLLSLDNAGGAALSWDMPAPLPLAPRRLPSVTTSARFRTAPGSTGVGFREGILGASAAMRLFLSLAGFSAVEGFSVGSGIGATTSTFLVAPLAGRPRFFFVASQARSTVVGLSSIVIIVGSRRRGFRILGLALVKEIQVGGQRASATKA